MVRGNWQARVERAERIKAERRALKEEREAGTLVQPEAVLAKLLRLDPEATVWLLHRDHDKLRPLCVQHFRLDACGNRRCKHSHALTIGRLRCGFEASPPVGATEPQLEVIRGPAELAFTRPVLGVAEEGAAGHLEGLPDSALHTVFSVTGDQEAAWLGASCRFLHAVYFRCPNVRLRKELRVPALQDHRRRQLLKGSSYKRLRYAATQGQLVYDWAEPEVWRQFHQQLVNKAAEEAAAAAAAASSVEPGSGGSRAREEAETAQPSTHGKWGPLPDRFLCDLFTFLSDADVCCRLCVACSAYRKTSRMDPAMRRRRRAGIERLQAVTKKDKKGKKKQGKHVAGKKDGFARGM